MTLISLIIILTIERLALRGRAWQAHRYFTRYVNLTKRYSGHQFSLWGVLLWLFTPVILLACAMMLFDSQLLEALIAFFVLAICVGCRNLRKVYKEYLNAANRNDMQACLRYAAALGQRTNAEGEATETLGQTLVWLNFKYYCGVMFWFVVLGAPGAVLYVMVREAHDMSKANSEEVIACASLSDKHKLDRQAALDDIDDEALEHIEKSPKAYLCYNFLSPYTAKLGMFIHILDWLPARLFSFGYLIIGNFSRGTGRWLDIALDMKVSARTVVADIAIEAEKVEAEQIHCTLEPVCMVKLVKRNLLFFLAVVALATLFGELS
ncbi:beta-lactamase regulator AmpE [Flocculibacter collagenilyticus]|uniref:beta-lactamase regulator AmpE n=1 Tax=Flocculibacter collagenilyticus TaxID=2744479 RepID=UPI0018F79362|nr:beta-lactamase regulator AmpE [Flocculibacter collagenilyticus]